MQIDTSDRTQTRALPPGWRTVRFGDVVRNVDVNERSPLESGIDRYVGLDHLDPESLHIKRWGQVADGTTFTRKFVAGQVLFGKRRAYQRKAAVAEFEGICSGDILVFEPSNGELIPELLPFIVQSDGFFNHALDTSAGSLSPRTKWKDLADYEFALPPRDEQRRIAEILWAADEANKKYKACQLIAERVHQSIVDELFIRGIQAKSESLKLTEIGRIPTSWETARLDSITTKIVDGVHHTPKYRDYGVPFVTVENLTAGKGISFLNVRYISEEDHREYVKRASPEKGDVLVSKDGTLGVARLIETDDKFSIFVSVALLKPIRNKLDGRFLRAYFETSLFKKRLQEKVSGSALKHIHLIDFRSTVLPLPPLEEQRQIAVVIEQSDDTLTAIQKQQDQIKMLQKALLNDFLS